MSHDALFLFMGCLGATFMAAQAAAPAVEITNEPHHHLTFENQYVRVFNVQVDPNTQTLTHIHHHDYIAITLGEAEISNTVQGKPTATMKLHDGDTNFSSGNFAHYVTDLGPQPFRNVTIELLQDESLRNSVASGKIHWDEDRGLDILEGGTKEILFVKDGVRVSEFELQPGGSVPAQRDAGPQLLVAVSDLDLRENDPGPNDMSSHAGHSGMHSNVKAAPTAGPELHMKSGDHKWLPANYSRTITNAGNQSAKFITLEFPQ
jgi:hypothetical protein